MTVFIKADCRTAERNFQSETIYKVEFAPHYNSGSRFLCLLYLETAIIKREIRCILMK